MCFEKIIMIDIPIKYDVIHISEKITGYAVNIEKIDNNLAKYIDDKLIKICKGKREVKLPTVKKEFIKYLEPKKQSTLMTGSVSEFFIHVFLNSQQFKQEFLYFNLEENSIKKGFDGYYSKDNKDWVLESKSTCQNNKKHKEILAIGFRGLKEKIEGIDNKNNPWEEAYHHASLGAVAAEDSLLQKINVLAEQYINEEYGEIKSFDIMVSSTIFLEDNWTEMNLEDLKNDITDSLGNKNYNSLIAICLNKKSTVHLLEYLKK